MSEMSDIVSPTAYASKKQLQTKFANGCKSIVTVAVLDPIPNRVCEPLSSSETERVVRKFKGSKMTPEKKARMQKNILCAAAAERRRREMEELIASLDCFSFGLNEPQVLELLEVEPKH